MTQPVAVANSKSQYTTKKYSSHQILDPTWNISNDRNGTLLMGYARRKEMSMNVWEKCPPGAWNVNSVVQLPDTMGLFNAGYQQYVPHIQDLEDSVIHTPFSAKNWTRLANGQSLENHFKAVPYNSTIFHEHGRDCYATKLLWPGMLTGASDTVQLRRKWCLGDQSQVAMNMNPCHQRVCPPGRLLYAVDCGFEDGHAPMVISSTKVKGERKVKKNRPKHIKQEKLPVAVTCPGFKHKKNGNAIPSLISCIPSESFIEKKSTQSTITITSEEVHDVLTVPKTTAPFVKDNPNPNGRGRSVSVISEIARTTTFENKGAELVKNSMVLRTSSEHAPSEKTNLMTSPASQRLVSDKTSVSEFVKSQGLLESNCEVRESFTPKISNIVGIVA